MIVDVFVVELIQGTLHLQIYLLVGVLELYRGYEVLLLEV